MFSLAFTKLKKIINYRESLLIDWNKFRLLSQILMNKESWCILITMSV